MKVAVLGDIHGNVPALDAVLADLDAERPDEVLLGGDLVGRGPQGSKVVQRVRVFGWRGVRGNHEDYLLSFRQGNVRETWLHADEWAASRWMASELEESDVETIDSLPLSIASETVPGLRLVHGSPRSYNEGLGPWTPDEELGRHLESIEENVLVCAHTHRAMTRRVSRGLVVNVGAVGLPFNRDQRAQYAILHHENGEWSAEARQVPYDVGRTLEIYRTSGFLQGGGVTARLLQLELEHAAPFLVPFTKWAAVLGVPVEISRIEPFLEFYDCEEGMRAFLDRLGALSSGSV